MSREIKFRAWITESAEMIDVDIIDLYYGDEAKYMSIFHNDDWIGVFELMQYTGKKNMYDDELFEGDIIRQISQGDTTIGVIYYSNEYCSFMVEFLNSHWYDEPFAELSWSDAPDGTDENWVVIGNIHEDKYLLK